MYTKLSLNYIAGTRIYFFLREASTQSMMGSAVGREEGAGVALFPEIFGFLSVDGIVGQPILLTTEAYSSLESDPTSSDGFKFNFHPSLIRHRTMG